MRRALGRRGAASAALLVATFLAMPAAPAAAKPVITIDSPKVDAALESASVSVSGRAVSDTPLLPSIRSVTLKLRDASRTIECSGSPCPFTWTQTLALNGPYVLTVEATEERLLNEPFLVTATRRFTVAAAPATPVLAPPIVGADRTVALSWSRNTEADMLYYAVFRKDPGGTTFTPVSGKVAQPATGAKVTFTDLSTSAFNGGDYAYRVVAVRKGPTGDDTSEAKSAASGAVSAAVPVPPTTTSTTLAPVPGAPVAGPGAATGGPTTTAKPGPPAGVDLSKFLSSRSQPIVLPPITVPEPPDTGFKDTLPFGARPPGEELEEGEQDAEQPNRRSSSIVSIDAGRPLVPVAAGLVLLLLALHLRLLGRRVKIAAAGDLPVDAVPTAARPVPIGTAPAAARPPRSTPRAQPVVVRARPPKPPTPKPAPRPEPTIYDVGTDDADDGSWAPTPPPVRRVEHTPRKPVFDEHDGAILDADPLEVFEVVSSSRRPLVRAGSR